MEALRRCSVGRPICPESRTPSRSASTATALAWKSRPRMAPSRERRTSRGRPVTAGSFRDVLTPSPSVKATCGWAMARRVTASVAWVVSVDTALRNLSRAGVAKNRSRTSTQVPGEWAAGFGSACRPPSIAMLHALSAFGGRLVMVSRDTAPMDGNASPRKPSVLIRVRSSSGSLDVAWRSTARPQVLGGHPRAVVGD